MDAQRFDAALRALQAGTTRRAGLAGALGVLAGASVARHVAAGKNGNGNKKPCSKATCPDGCCDGTTCNRGTKDSACGTKGKSCEKCAKGKTCQNQQCRTKPCSASTCANGCCSGTTCVTATSASACGTGGAVCASCSGATPICASGTCVECASNADCSSSSPHCSAGTCGAGQWANQTTFGAGPGTGNDSFDYPNGLFLSDDELTAWVADSYNNRVSVWTRSSPGSTTWSYSAKFGTSGSGNDNLDGPAAVFASKDMLTAWVADRSNNRVSVWTRPNISSPTWSYSAQFGTAGSGNENLQFPKGIFVSADTLTAWVADSSNSRISVWTRTSSVSLTWSYSTQFGSYGSGNDNFDTPTCVFVASDMLTAWVVDNGNNRIAVWVRPSVSSTTWSYRTQFGSDGSSNGNFSFPFGIFVSADSLTAWVADSSNNRISIWTRSDSSSTTWSYAAKFGSSGSGPNNFSGPNGISVSADALTAWVADTGNNRISIWTQS